MADPIPDLLVELLLLGELPEPEARELRRRLEAEGDPRLEQLERSNEAVLERYPPSMMVPRLRRRLGWSPVVRRWRIPTAMLASAAAVALVWTLGSGRPPESTRIDPQDGAMTRAPSPAPERIIDKGSERLLVHRKLPGGSEQLESGAQVDAGDVLQLGYVPGQQTHGVIVSIDGAEGVSLHWPPTTDDETALAEGPTQLEYAFELDGSPRFERFFFVTARESIEVSDVMEAARSLASQADAREAPLGLPERWDQLGVVLLKRED